MPELLSSRRQALAVIAAAVTLSSQTADALAAPPVVALSRQKYDRDTPFNDGWLFHRGVGRAFEAPGFDDRNWRVVNLPHDWSVEDIPGTGSPFDNAAIGGGSTGFTQGGEGWYRKHFRLEGVAPDARVEISFDGIHEISDVWLNGIPIGGSVQGYSPFWLDLSSALDRTGDNVLAVRVRNEGQNSRWYAGSGIYREVRLDVLPSGTRIARWGVAGWTRRIARGAAVVEVTSRVHEPAATLSLITRLRDASGRVVAEATAPAVAEVRQTLTVRGARLWSPADPYLHTLETELRNGDTVVDCSVQPFGLRIVTFDPQHGMAINGVVTKLRGGCVHHDTGLLGACAFREADERRVRLLQARGFNAIRSAHNIASRSLRETCDRLGMLMIDEAFDMWHFPKNPQDFSTRFARHWESVLEALVLPARNSPSIIMWSIGNEVPRRTTAEGVEWQWRLANTVRRLDPSRPVTAAIHGTLGPVVIPARGTVPEGKAGRQHNASVVFLDIPGFNYRLDEIIPEHAQHPERVVYASETYAKNVFDYRRLMDSAPYFLGEFIWTAMDYIGEAAIGRSTPIKPGTSPFALATWPYTGANCGDLDLTGAPKPPSLARDVAWGLSPIEVLVHRPMPAGTVEYVTNWGWPDELPAWTWPGQEGKPLSVRIFTSGDRVDVLLNNAKIATKTVTQDDRMSVSLDVPYAPGELEVVAYRAGKVLGRKRHRTAGTATGLRLTAEHPTLAARTDGLAYVRIQLCDAGGLVLPDDQREIRITHEGPASIAAFGSGNPEWTGSLQGPSTRLFGGSALAILRSTGLPGPIKLTAQGDGVQDGSVTLFAT
jgi:beta-galactosidase